MVTKRVANKPSRYQEAGVNTAIGNDWTRHIGSNPVYSTCRGELNNIGGFAALFDLAASGMQQPILVSGCDGVGTKLKLAVASGRHQEIGVDLVAMCVNDILVYGAIPLFFLDYYATGQLDVAVAESVISGIRSGCEQAGCGLVGGETAEMPGMYADGEYDLAGFCVGAVDKCRLIDGSQVRAGDRLIALPATGYHANGYSLIRQILHKTKNWQDTVVAGENLLDILLTPTRIYVQPVQALLQQISVHAMAHITGGGLVENIPRTLPAGVIAHIHTDSWQPPKIFHWLAEQGDIPWPEMYATFNCGIGMVLCVAGGDISPALSILAAEGISAWCCGEVTAADSSASAATVHIQ